RYLPEEGASEPLGRYKADDTSTSEPFQTARPAGDLADRKCEKSANDGPPSGLADEKGGPGEKTQVRTAGPKSKSDDLSYTGPVVEPITAGEMDELRRRGFSPDELFNMSPTQARKIIANPERNKLTERYGKGSDAPPETICQRCKKPGARFFRDRDPLAG